MTWLMPAETAPQDRVWMAFPVDGYTLGTDAYSADEARGTWTAVAHAVLEFEPVTMVVDPAEVATARRYLSAEIEIIEAPLDDAWMRDIGPSFVLGDDGQLGAVDWAFNGWGAQDWARWGKDMEVGRLVTAASGASAISSVLVNEGGGIHVDGAGTVLATQTVQLDPGRNPYVDRARIEAEFARTLGATRLVWLPRGLSRDQQRYGTRGHVDMVAALPSPGTVLIHAQNDPAHPDYAVTRQLRAVLAEETDAAGRPFTIVDLPAPAALTDEDGFVDYNYVNHLVVNGGVIACGFGEERADQVAREILAAAYPGRTVVSVEARPLFARGGGIHCITQQQPSAG
ncbi:agmatine deiminase family protein [Cryobacterium sp. TMT2-17-1]|uniref:agmatine deiminase family protein n=1 Tax=unclassified Cryobacterium TaxID=2649013 RepID=UPI000CE43C5C|nr:MULTISPECIES: agmatine deiminase family protein [unclassified Cryobacterium]TFB54939.1 agmatine deiminase family protein [Cryobacterium sp. Sr3]TFB58108.1 agmatine deiminase family protein [Cryobacterium sp. Hz7]TFC40304.1 agmatine deiminase family protein [Cryobacterium sp. TMT2-14]TFC53189.1 agmatine deiminase family protein [Cryobacterium sp. TMT2-17-1]TFC65921.1 agmatine deiminase family protein [Cryobacterium sp. TMT2-4]